MYLSHNMKINELGELILDKNTPTTDIDNDKKGRLSFYANRNSIFIPDLTVRDYCTKVLSSIEASCAHKIIREILINNKIIEVGRPLKCLPQVVFYLLHEEGHYYHFNKEYLSLQKDYKDFLADYNKLKYLCEFEFQRIFNDKQTNKAHLANQKLYREIQFERIADNYAVNKILNRSDLLKLFNNN